MEIVHRDEKGKVLERRSRERGEKTAVKGRTWRAPDYDRRPLGHGGEVPGKGHGTDKDKGDQPADRWVRVGKDRVHGVGKTEWEKETPVPDKE